MGADREWRICVEENPNARRRGKGEAPSARSGLGIPRVIAELGVILSPTDQFFQQCGSPGSVTPGEACDVQSSAPCQVVQPVPWEECSGHLSPTRGGGHHSNSGQPGIGPEQALGFLGEKKDIGPYLGPEGTAPPEIAIGLGDLHLSDIPAHRHGERPLVRESRLDISGSGDRQVLFLTGGGQEKETEPQEPISQRPAPSRGFRPIQVRLLISTTACVHSSIQPTTPENFSPKGPPPWPQRRQRRPTPPGSPPLQRLRRWWRTRAPGPSPGPVPPKPGGRHRPARIGVGWG